MRKRSLFLCLFLASNAHAAFEDVGVGARAPGMADAFVAVADDATSLFYNPAGLGQLKEGQLYTDYGQPFSGTNNDNSTTSTGYVALAQPLNQGRYGTVAASYNAFQVTNLYDEHTIALGYGVKLNVPFLPDTHQWLLGVSVKQLHVGFDSSAVSANGLNSAGFSTGQPNPLFANYGYSSNAWAFDAGTLYKFGESQQYSLGLDAANINRPDISLSGVGDSAPFFTRLGASWRSPWALFTVEGRRIQYLADLTDYEGALGAERAFGLGHYGSFIVRGGYAQGSREYQVATIGASYQLDFLQIDYAFDFPIGSLTDSDLGYNVGLSLKWGGHRTSARRESAPPPPESLPETRFLLQQVPAEAPPPVQPQ